MEKKLYKIRKTMPEEGDKWYTKKGYDKGVSTCILGYPEQWKGSVLSNCVGYAFGRVAEMCGELTKIGCYGDNDYPASAQNWWKANDGFERTQDICVGAVAVWKSNLGDSGHVAVVEDIVSYGKNGECHLSDSAWRGAGFRYYGFSNDMKKRGYTFLGFIKPKYDYVLKIEPDKSLNDLAKEVIAGKWGNNPKRKERLTDAYKRGEIKYTYDEIQARVNDMLWNDINVGDKVKIVASGNSQADGKGNSARSGLVRYVLKIHEGAEYPYQVGNDKGTTGFYRKNALTKL